MKKKDIREGETGDHMAVVIEKQPVKKHCEHYVVLVCFQKIPNHFCFMPLAETKSVDGG